MQHYYDFQNNVAIFPKVDLAYTQLYLFRRRIKQLSLKSRLPKKSLEVVQWIEFPRIQAEKKSKRFIIQISLEQELAYFPRFRMGAKFVQNRVNSTLAELSFSLCNTIVIQNQVKYIDLSWEDPFVFCTEIGEYTMTSPTSLYQKYIFSFMRKFIFYASRIFHKNTYAIAL